MLPQISVSHLSTLKESWSRVFVWTCYSFFWNYKISMFSFWNDATSSMFLVLGSCLRPGLFPSLCPVCYCLVHVSCVQHVWSKRDRKSVFCLCGCLCSRLVYDTFVVLVVVFFPFLFHIPLCFVLLFPIVKFICLLCVSVCYFLFYCWHALSSYVLCSVNASPVSSESPTDLCHIIYLAHAVCSVS